MGVRGAVPASYYQPAEGGEHEGETDEEREARIDRRLDEDIAVVDAVYRAGGTQEEAVAAHRAHVLARRGRARC